MKSNQQPSSGLSETRTSISEFDKITNSVLPRDREALLKKGRVLPKKSSRAGGIMRFRPFFLIIYFAGAFACLTAEAQAQDVNQISTKDTTELSLEELINVRVDYVFSASKYEQKVTEAPASVSIITANEIKKFGYRSLADVLGGVRGFFIANDRNYYYLGSRGFRRPGDYNTRYLFLIDGHRMNDNIFGGGFFGTEGFLDVDLIERAEVIRGPSSSIYGNSAFLGVINIITKKGRQIDGTESSAEVGSFETYKGQFSFGKKFSNDIEWLVSGSYYTSDGQNNLYYPEFDQRISSDPRARNNGEARNSDAEKAHRFFTSASYHDFTVIGLYLSRTKDVPTAPFGSFFGNGPSQTTDERGYVELKYNHQFDEYTELLGRLSYDVFPHLGKYPYDYGGNNQPSDIAIDYDGDFGNWLTTEVQLKQRVFDQHTVIVGAEYREDLEKHLFNYDSENTTFIEDRRKGRSFGVYSQAEIVLHTNLLMNAGLRFDYYDTFGSTLNPRVGLIYNPLEKTTFKLLYGQAFRAPNDYELYYGSPAFGQTPNPNLQPENIRTYEIIYEQYLPAHLRFNTSGYYYDINNLISQTLEPGTGLVVFENVDHVQAKGIEFELESKYPGGLIARASYALQRTEDANTNAELNSSPRHLIKGNLIVPLFSANVFAGLELQYQSSIKTLAGQQMNDFVIGNLTLFSKDIIKGLDVSGSVYNLFDTKYGSLGARDHLQDIIPQDGRSVRAKLTYRL